MRWTLHEEIFIVWSIDLEAVDTLILQILLVPWGEVLGSIERLERAFKFGGLLGIYKSP